MSTPLVSGRGIEQSNQHTTTIARFRSTNQQQLRWQNTRWGIKCNAASCNFGEMVLADVKQIADQKHHIHNPEQKVERMWGKQ
eukprot:2396052-Amphidinium_carterae.1